MDRDKLYSNDILDAVAKIDQVKDAVVHEVQIIGEAAKRLSNSFKEKYDLPWEDIIGIRDKIVHDYFKVDWRIIWDTAKNDVPALKQKLESS